MRALYLLFPDSEEGAREVEILENCPFCFHSKIRFPNGREEWVMRHYLKVLENAGSTRPVPHSITEKVIHFKERLPEYIMKGQKDITWRVDDEKDIELGDALSLRNSNGEEFGRAEVLWVKETTFGKLTEEDKKGHERFNSDEEMYRTYSEYYRKPVVPETPVKVIKFRLL